MTEVKYINYKNSPPQDAGDVELTTAALARVIFWTKDHQNQLIDVKNDVRLQRFGQTIGLEILSAMGSDASYEQITSHIEEQVEEITVRYQGTFAMGLYDALVQQEGAQA